MRTTLPLLGGRAMARALAVNAQRSVNWDPRPEPEGAKTRLVLAPTPGLVQADDTSTGPTRSDFVKLGEKVYWVSATSLYSRDVDGTRTTIGTVPGDGWCVLAAGFTYLVVVNGVDGFYTTGSGLTSIRTVDADFPPNPTYVAFLDGYFIVNNSATGRFFISDLTAGNEDPTSWDPLKFANAEADSDNATAVHVVLDRLYISGTRSIQLFYNSGNPDFPFESFSNGVLEWGAESPASIAIVDGLIFLLARSKGGGLDILKIAGTTASSIADHEFLRELDGYVTSDAEGYGYSMDGMVYYVLTLPSEPMTFVYNVTSKMWYEWTSPGLERHQSRGHGFFNGKHFVGNYSNGKIYTLDPSVFTEGGSTLIRSRTTSITHLDGRDIECSEFEIEFKKGVALITGSGSDPSVMMRYSTDGGNSMSNTLRADLGGIGDLEMRVIYRRLGQGRSYVYEFSIAEPIDATVVAIYGDLTALAA